MDFIIEEKSFDLSLTKSMAIYENASSLLEIAIFESDSDIMLEASFEEFKKKAMDAIDKIIKTVKEFCKKVRMKLDTQVQKIKLNFKLSEIKNILATKKANALGQKYNMMEIHKYKKFYRDFINKYTSEFKQGLNKKFNSVDEYITWEKSMLKKLDDFNYKLSDEEQWRLSTSVNSAIKLTSEELQNRENNLKMIEDAGCNAIDNVSKHYKKIDIDQSHANYEAQNVKITRMKNTLIGRVCCGLSNAVKHVVSFISKHTLIAFLALIAIIL